MTYKELSEAAAGTNEKNITRNENVALMMKIAQEMERDANAIIAGEFLINENK
jgi:hypothetical protein